MIALIIIIGVVCFKYKPVYKVTYLGEMAGYVENKDGFEKIIQEQVMQSTEKNVAFITLDNFPNYELKFIDKDVQTNEEQILAKIKEDAETTYQMYAITLNDENKCYVATLEEAEDVVKTIKEENEAEIELNLGINQIYTTNLEELQTVEVADATNNIDTDVKEAIKIAEKEKAIQIAKENNNVFEGVYFTTKPVEGVITSRFGNFESIRSSSHKGIDIGAPNGTPIKAAADGTVTFAGSTSGGYGNLVVISHGNGIETYYGHCSKVYVTKGQTVSAGEVIAAVGSTGFSTGNHLHFEIRKNDSQVNPELYVY